MQENKLTLESNNRPQLQKSLSLNDSICIVLGSVIGSGIFVSPSAVFNLLRQSPFLSLIAWLVAALISIAGALCYAELGCMFPKAGAEYEYLKHGMGQKYGKFWAFLFAWVQLLVLGTGSIAIMAGVSANYLVKALWVNGVPSNSQAEFTSKIVATLLVLILTIINCYGIKLGSKIQNILTILKVMGIVLLLIIGIICFQHLNWIEFTKNFFGAEYTQTSLNLKTSLASDIAKFGGALIACLWAYDGWNNLSRVNEESIDIQKTLPKGLIIGISSAAVIYLSLNLFYFLTLSPTELSSTKAVALSAINTLSDKAAWLKYLPLSLILGILIAISAGGATNGSLLSGARIFFAAGRDGLFFGSLAKLNEQTKAPVHSLIVQGFWAIALILIGNFESLLSYFSFSAWIFYALCAGILIHLRIAQPNAHRPYKMPLFPFIPIVFLLAAIYLILSQIASAPIQSGLSFLSILSGGVFYLFAAKRK